MFNYVQICDDLKSIHFSEWLLLLVNLVGVSLI